MAHLATARGREPAPAVRSPLSPAEPPRPPREAARWVPAAIGLGALALWEALARLEVIPSFYFPAPSAILASLVSLTTSGELAAHLGATFGRFLPGLGIGVAAGLLLGLSMGWSRRFRTVADPFVAAFHPIPKIAILPLFMLILGIGETSKIAVISISAFFPMLINTMAGVRQISPVYFEVATNYGASVPRLFRRVIFPGSLPMALSGFRLALNSALVVTIAVEIISAHNGLGALIWLSWELLRPPVLYASLLVTAVVGMASNSGLEWMTRRVVPWQVERGGTAR